jgi:2-(1,2-epoxy-1,2-dihydrophenyl)acetyl-CoA isomerase
MEMSEDLKLEIEGAVASITLNRPRVMNAMTFQMWGRLLEIVQELEHNADVRCVVLKAAGDNFCSGQDVSEFAKLAEMTPSQLATQLMRELDKTNPLFLAMERIPQPIVASVRGLAAGGGLSLVVAADLIVASETAKFYAAQIKLGAIADASLTFNLRRAIGIKKAKQYCMLGETMDAQTASDLGLVNWVVADDRLEEETVNVARRLAGMAPVAIARTKSALNRSFNNTLAEHAADEPLDVSLCVKAPEFMNNVRAFAERRRAR